MSGVTVYGVCAVYGLLSGAWPFGVVEAIWAVVDLRRYVTTPAPT